MSLLLISVITLLGILLGRFIFKKWFNHLTLYCFIFGGSIFLYEIKLLPYIELTPITWFVVICSFLSFLFGTLTIISKRNLEKERPLIVEKSDVSLKIFSDGGRTLKYAIIILSLISLYSAYDFWKVLINQFGSIPAVLINSKVIYSLNVSGKLKGTIPYIALLGYVAVFLAGIYTAYKRKFTLLTFIPLISVILREIAGAGRVGMLMALVEFTFSFFLFRHLLNSDLIGRYKFSKANAIIASIILLVVFVGSASLVRVSRMSDTTEKFSGASSTLMQTKENFIISPSVYFYLSSDVGVLSMYLSSDGENTGFGQNTFLTIYTFLSKLDLVRKPQIYQKYYKNPVWTNTGTYLRELHADFGTLGILLGPFLLGLFLTWLWYRFFRTKSLITFSFLVFLNIIVGLSFFVMATRVLYWFVTLVLVIIIIPFLEKIATLIPTKRLNN
jgi:oligosaccharide repeat unit polymerase